MYMSVYFSSKAGTYLPRAGWFYTEMVYHLKIVTRVGTNQDRCRLTVLIRPMLLTVMPSHQRQTVESINDTH